MNNNRTYNGIPAGVALQGSIAQAKTYRQQRRDPATGKYAKGSGTLKQNYQTHNNPNTGLQILNRQRMRHAMAAWAELTDEQKQTYIDRAHEIRKGHQNPFDRRKWMLGHSLFVSEYEEVDKLLEPQYDSGWTNINQGQQITLTHNLAHDVDKMLIQMEGKGGDCGLTINDLGGTSGVGHFESGFYWCTLTATQININRGASDTHALQVRIRIWIYE